MNKSGENFLAKRYYEYNRRRENTKIKTYENFPQQLLQLKNLSIFH